MFKPPECAGLILPQVSRSQFHNALEADLTLLSDYQAGVECLPTKLIQVSQRGKILARVVEIPMSREGESGILPLPD